MNFSKITIATLAIALAVPTFAQASGPKMGQDAKKMDVSNEQTMVRNYIRSLQEELEDHNVFFTANGDAVSSEDIYAEWVQLSKQALNEGNEKSLRAFALMSNRFQEEIGVEPSYASMEQYRQFYQKHADNPIILATIAMWANHSMDGILPYRHSIHSFWDNPTQAATMYNTMAAIDINKVFPHFLMGIKADLNSAYATCAEKDKIHAFFTQFAAAGSVAQKDANLLEESVFDMVEKAF